MANLKRNMIELIKNPDEVASGGEVELEKYWTPPFLPLQVTYEALDVMSQISELEKDNKVVEMIDLLVEFVAKKSYAEQFSVDELKERLHAPDAIQALQDQVLFIAQGQQSDATKKFLEKKN